MKLMVGLGNPGVKYERNRHNVGFMFTDGLVEYFHTQKNCEVRSEQNFDSIYTKLVIDTETIIVTKPQTFMNRSGDAVRMIANFYKISPVDMIVAHDDLDILLGKYKLQAGVGPKVHNGILSVEEKLGTKDFMRVRIGVDNRNGDRRMSGEAYVLQDFTGEEIEIVQKTFQELYPQVAKELGCE